MASRKLFRARRQSWLGKSGQRDKWIFCLMMPSMAARIAGRVGCDGGQWLLLFPLRLLEAARLQEGIEIIVISACRCRPVQERPLEVAKAEFHLALLMSLFAEPACGSAWAPDADPYATPLIRLLHCQRALSSGSMPTNRLQLWLGTKGARLLRLQGQDEYRSWSEPWVRLGVTGSTMPLE
jgi:hypothetical protein